MILDHTLLLFQGTIVRNTFKCVILKCYCSLSLVENDYSPLMENLQNWYYFFLRESYSLNSWYISIWFLSRYFHKNVLLCFETFRILFKMLCWQIIPELNHCDHFPLMSLLIVSLLSLADELFLKRKAFDFIFAIFFASKTIWITFWCFPSSYENWNPARYVYLSFILLIPEVLSITSKLLSSWFAFMFMMYLTCNDAILQLKSSSFWVTDFVIVFSTFFTNRRTVDCYDWWMLIQTWMNYQHHCLDSIGMFNFLNFHIWMICFLCFLKLCINVCLNEFCCILLFFKLKT